MIYHVVHTSMPGYMPEGEPVVISDDEHAPVEVLRYMRDEVSRVADQHERERENDDWDDAIAAIERDLERAGDFDVAPGSGFSYIQPDGYLIQATAYTREQLVELGYTPGEDFD